MAQYWLGLRPGMRSMKEEYIKGWRQRQKSLLSSLRLPVLTSSSGRGFTRTSNVKPDFMVDGMNAAGPLPDNKWGLITGTRAASTILVGISSLIYEDQTIQEEEPSNTLGMKAILVEQAIREPTIIYPNPSRGYGLIDISSVIYE